MKPKVIFLNTTKKATKLFRLCYYDPVNLKRRPIPIKPASQFTFTDSPHDLQMVKAIIANCHERFETEPKVYIDREVHWCVGLFPYRPRKKS